MAAAATWVPYAERPEWADVQPLPVDSGAVVAIQYSARARDVLGYFAAVLQTGEKSQRVLELTADVINANSADYTAWQHRWEVLTALGGNLAEEYAFTHKIADDCAKNYQLWNHRRKLAAALGPDTAQQELQFCEAALDADAKNYHAWAHRQAVVAVAAGASGSAQGDGDGGGGRGAAGGSVWDAELAYADRLLQDDVRNNSAWNQRAFVLQHTLGAAPSLQALLDRELEYVAAALQRAPDNESAWNYLAGLFSLPGCRAHELGRQDKVFVICREALADAPSCRPALDMLAAWYASLAGALRQAGDADAARTAARHGLTVLSKAALADPMRAHYWRWREQQLQDDAGPQQQQG